MAKRDPAQKAAEKAYRAKFESVLVRLTTAEGQAIDGVRGDLSRAEYLKAKGLAAAKRRTR